MTLVKYVFDQKACSIASCLFYQSRKWVTGIYLCQASPKLAKDCKTSQIPFPCKIPTKEQCERTRSTRSLVIVGDKKRGGEILITLFHWSVLRKLLRLLLIRLRKFFRHLFWIWWFFTCMHFREAHFGVFLGFAFYGFSFPSFNHILYIQEVGRGIILPLNRFFLYSFCRPKTYDFLLRPLSAPFLFHTSGKGTDSATPLEMEKYGRIGFLPCKRSDIGQIDSHIFFHLQGGRRPWLWFSQSSWLDYHFLQKAMYSSRSMSIHKITPKEETLCGQIDRIKIISLFL